MLFFLVASVSCLAMEKSQGAITPQVSAATTRAIISQKENIFKALQGDIEQGKFVSFDTLTFTNKSVGDALKTAKDKGACIEGTLGTHYANKNMQMFFDENDMNVTKKSQNHLKRFLISEKDPLLGSPGKCTVYEGSANPTNYAYHNYETMIQTKDDKPFFMEHFKDHTNVMHNISRSAASEKKILEITPKKENKAFGSDENILSESKVRRVKTLIKSKNKERVLYITSMNWNSIEMTQALIAAQRSGIIIKVILNSSALKGNGKDQLEQMHKAGVPIYIFDLENSSRNIQHSKIMLRIDGPEHLVVSSTANMTPEGDRESNIDSYYPEAEQVAKDVQKSLDELIASDSCKPYEQAVAALAENEKKEVTDKKTVASKKRLNFDEPIEFDSEDNQPKLKKAKK